MSRTDKRSLFLPVLLRDDYQHDEYEDARNAKNKDQSKWDSGF